MKTALLFLALMSASVVGALAQETAQVPAEGATIESAQVTGVPEESLSVDLRDALRMFVGQRYDAKAAADFAARVEREVPDVLAAPRVLAGSESARVRLVFVIASAVPGETEQDSNVNSQYTVEAVEVRGADRSQYSNAIYEEMQEMVGQKLDNDRIEELRGRLFGELDRQYFVSQKVERGSKPEHVKVTYTVERVPWLLRATLGRILNDWNIRIGTDSAGPAKDRNTVEAVDIEGIPRSQVSDAVYGEMQMMVGKRIDELEINHLREKLRMELNDEYAIRTRFRPGKESRQTRVVFEADWIPWLPYRTPEEMLGYHPKQGWSLLCCEDDFIGKYTTLTAGWDGNSLIERHKGFRFGLESTSLGSRRLGGRLQFDSLGVQWKPQTRLALEGRPEIPGLYRSRIGIAPSLAFAFNRNIFITAGADFTELRMEGPSEHWDAAHAGVASIRYDSKKIERGKTYFEHLGGYEVRTGARSIGSDFVYTRHSVEHSSTFGHGNHSLKLTFGAGKITGSAPLFERFSLGNLETLRGWNKYDIDPLGGSRFWHHSLTYRYSELGLFMDVGDVWDPGMPHDVRTSVGVTALGWLGMAVPLKCSQQCGPTFYVHF
jgi:hypothetical protein